MFIIQDVPNKNPDICDYKFYSEGECFINTMCIGYNKITGIL